MQVEPQPKYAVAYKKTIFDSPGGSIGQRFCLLPNYCVACLLLICVVFILHAESNDVLKLKFKRLHRTVVNSVNPAGVIDFLFQEGIVGADDMRALRRFKDDPKEQCTELLTLLHTSENPQSFIKLYAAIRQESYLRWLIVRIDSFSDQSVVDLLQQQHYTSEPTGCMGVLSKTSTRLQEIFYIVTWTTGTHQ